MVSSEENSKSGIIFRFALTAAALAAVALIVVHFLKVSGLGEKLTSVEELRDYIASLGGNAVVAAIVFMILQTVVLPVPGAISVCAVVALFGPFKGAIYCLIGVLIGSFISFFIGKKIGYKGVSWLVGKNAVDRVLNKLNGKDKAFLTFAFFMPFFPDDALCFVAGLSKMKLSYFAVVISITRLISIFATAYSVNGDLIPYDTPWGIAAWCAIIVFSFALSRLLFKNYDKIKDFFIKKK